MKLRVRFFFIFFDIDLCRPLVLDGTLISVTRSLFAQRYSMNARTTFPKQHTRRVIRLNFTIRSMCVFKTRSRTNFAESSGEYNGKEQWEQLPLVFTRKKTAVGGVGHFGWVWFGWCSINI